MSFGCLGATARECKNEQEGECEKQDSTASTTDHITLERHFRFVLGPLSRRHGRSFPPPFNCNETPQTKHARPITGGNTRRERERLRLLSEPRIYRFERIHEKLKLLIRGAVCRLDGPHPCLPPIGEVESSFPNHLLHRSDRMGVLARERCRRGGAAGG